MRKTFVLLLVAAVAVWGYVVFQFLGAYFGGGQSATQAPRFETAPAAVLTARQRIPLDTAYRDPFQPYLYAQKPAPVAPVKEPAIPRPALVVIEPPKASLSGVLWGDPPVAILKQDGATEVVKEGAEAFGLKVIKIERHQVTVTKQGRKFVLGY